MQDFKRDKQLCRLKGGASVARIPQTDGMDDAFIEDRKPEKSIYGVNCSVNSIIQLFNLMRSFNFLWITMDSHKLCDISQSCFFCNMRSSSLRLRQSREKGPKSLQINEFVCQLFQYSSNLGWDWELNANDMLSFIENTIQLLLRNEKEIALKFAKSSSPKSNIHDNEEGIEEFVYKVKIGLDKQNKTYSMEEVIMEAVKQDQCKLNESQSPKKEQDYTDKCLIIHLSTPISMRLEENGRIIGYKIQYRSHL